MSAKLIAEEQSKENIELMRTTSIIAEVGVSTASRWLMEVPMRLKIIVAILALGLISVAGLGVAYLAGEKSMLSLSLVHELEMTGMCANGLKLIGDDRNDALIMLLEDRLDSAIKHASQMVDDGIELDIAAPNLIDSVRRASDYYVVIENEDSKLAADNLLAELRATQ